MGLEARCRRGEWVLPTISPLLTISCLPYGCNEWLIVYLCSLMISNSCCDGCDSKQCNHPSGHAECLRINNSHRLTLMHHFSLLAYPIFAHSPCSGTKSRGIVPLCANLALSIVLSIVLAQSLRATFARSLSPQPSGPARPQNPFLC